MTETNFEFTPTQDWASGHYQTWSSLFSLIKSPSPRILEIGSWEGRSAVFLLQNLAGDGGEIVCVDHFDLESTEAGRERYRKMAQNLSSTGKSFRIVKDFSVSALYNVCVEEMTTRNPGYDWVYIDGSHEADDTFLDGELSWRLARKGAVFIFDDYRWDKDPEASRHHPKRGIDAFLDLHRGEYRILSGTKSGEYQMILVKTTDMRIGFLSSSLPTTKAVFQSPINIAVAIDSAYAMPATVALRSLLEATSGRITIYIGDCGIDEDDKERLLSSLPHRDDVTLQFISLKASTLSAEMGLMWAKIDMITALPVERVLYLDADTIVRKDLVGLWEMDLSGCHLGAAVDIGHPTGHDDLKVVEYFNAGVLLMDLTVIREGKDSLVLLARQMKDSKFGDQDVLNTHFRDSWKKVSLTWNAQGLGTYAGSPSRARDRLPLEEIEDPAIVHFSGPTHPSLALILNPWVQPYTAKPWGYAGSPGHPYGDLWWSILERTSWAGWKSTAEHAAMVESESQRVVEEAASQLRKRIQASK